LKKLWNQVLYHRLLMETPIGSTTWENNAALLRNIRIKMLSPCNSPHMTHTHTHTHTW
jgi:hypothetical protein